MQELIPANEKCIKRVNYFDRQFLTKDEFTVEQNYHLDKKKRHNLMLHSSGIVEEFEFLRDETTLDITNKTLTVQIGKGYAIDSLGREILIPDDCYVKGEYTLNETEFNNIGDFSISVFMVYSEQYSDNYQYEDMEDNKEEEGKEKEVRKPRIAEIPKIEFSVYKDGHDLPKEEEKGRFLIGRLYKKDNGEYDLDKSEIKWADLHVAGELTVGKSMWVPTISSYAAGFTSIEGNSITADNIIANYIARKYIDKLGNLNVGDVVVSRDSHEVYTTNKPMDECVCGVVVRVEEANEGQTVYIAYSGVCNVKIDPNEKIESGNLLVTSTKSGCVSKFTYTKYMSELFKPPRGINIEDLKFQDLNVKEFLNNLYKCFETNGAILGKALSGTINNDNTIPVLLMLK